MSGNNLRRVTTGSVRDDRPDERLTPLVESTDGRSTTDRDAIPDSLLDSVIDDVADGTLTVDDDLVTQNLDEILLALITLSSGGTHGTALMDQLSNLFDAELSPGTVYPCLHDFESAGTLQMHELVQTKQYSIADGAAAESAIEQAAYQHFLLGMFLYRSLDAL